MPPLLYLGALVAGVVAKWVLGGSIAPGSALRLVAGAVLVAAGVAVGLRFSRAFERAGQDRSPRTPTPSIVSDGLYRYSRNPAYVSLTAILLGLAFLLDNPWLLGLTVPVVVVMHFGVILREEAYLQRKFGDEYLRYKEQVRRWL
jgi:protein-S-isoprenylcysteine O-methyltransferase Ste14